jgi:aryl-alcohol dehydrogenase-like predicted oxidoreductase
MNDDRMSRRDFIRNGSLVAAGSVAGLLTKGCGSGVSKSPARTKIVNYHQQMHYHRLGKTGLYISEVSLGGHWKDRSGGRYWDTFANDEVPEDVAKNRSEVISACIDAGINYLDITTAAECLSYGVALKGRRHKMIVGADDHRLGPRNPKNRTLKALLHNIDECLRRLQMDYLDIWRVQAKTDGTNTDEEVAIMVEAFEKAHKVGKALHFGISTHSRPWAQHVIEEFPQVEMFIFPCSAKTRVKGAAPTKDSVEEVNPGYGADQAQSIFEVAQRRDVGIVTIKPFFGGSLFKSYGKDTFPIMGVGSKRENDLARLTLQCILTNKAITATVPGLSTIYEVENAARASYTRELGMAPAEKDWLMETTNSRWANLPAEYCWLRDWEVI